MWALTEGLNRCEVSTNICQGDVLFHAGISIATKTVSQAMEASNWTPPFRLQALRMIEIEKVNKYVSSNTW